MTALNPFLTVEEQLIEVTMHMGLNRKKWSARDRVIKKSKIPGAEKRIRRLPTSI